MPTPKTEPVMTAATLAIILMWIARLVGLDMTDYEAMAVATAILAGGALWARSRVTPVK